MAKRKTKKEDAGSTYGAREQEDQLREAEKRSGEPGRMVPSSMEPALRQSTQTYRKTYSEFSVISYYAPQHIPWFEIQLS